MTKRICRPNVLASLVLCGVFSVALAGSPSGIASNSYYVYTAALDVCESGVAPNTVSISMECRDQLVGHRYTGQEPA